MITGNPGCIGYYHEFLSLLWDELGELTPEADVSIFGVSMNGFVDHHDHRHVLGLQGQIEYLERYLMHYMGQYLDSSDDGDDGDDDDDDDDRSVEHRVVIIGHSVGAYIGLELIRRYQEEKRREEGEGFQMMGFVGLWPTVTHIAQSKRGRRVGVRCVSVPFNRLSNLIMTVVVEIAVLRFGDQRLSKSSPIHPRTILDHDHPQARQISRAVR